MSWVQSSVFGASGRGPGRASTPQVLTERSTSGRSSIMWLIHVGFMAYEAGAARRKNVMSTAMKNILTIAVVTPTFYYFGWYIYGCFEQGWPMSGHVEPRRACPASAARRRRGATSWARTCSDHITPSSSWRSCSSPGRRARSCPARSSSASASPPTCCSTVILGSVVWIMDAAWGWSSGGWLTTRYGFHDSIASRRRPRRRGRVHARRPAQPRAAHRQVRPEGRASRTFRPPQHPPDADGADAHLHRLLRLLRRLPRDPVDGLPRLAEHLPLADDARLDRVRDHDRLRGRLHGRVVREQGRPVLDALRRPRRGDLRLGRRRRLPPVARLPARVLRRRARRLGRRPTSRRSCASTTRSGPSPSTGSAASTACFSVGIFAGGYPTGHQQRRLLVRRPAHGDAWRSSRSASSPATSSAGS